MSEYVHTSVMLGEVLSLLRPRDGETYADVTLGMGGHTLGILEASAPSGHVIGLDRDPKALEAAKTRLADYPGRVTFAHASFAELPEVLEGLSAAPLAGLVADLGVSSGQLGDVERGFSFATDGPLDMRMDTTQGPTAREWLQDIDEKSLADWIYRASEERKSRPIARSIVRARDEGRLETTQDLRRAVVRAIGPRRSGGIDPATRTFQAVRMAVNGELEQIERLLASLPRVLAPSGVAAIISFHSLEDRLVKHAFRNDERLEPITKKPVVATDEEQKHNPRSRSAKLRAARRVSEVPS